MKILHILPGLMTGGQETLIINLANEQVKSDEVFVLIINKDYDTNLLSLFNSKVKIIFVNRPRSSKNLWYFIKLNYLIYKCHPNIIHSHYEKIVRFIILKNIKFVYTVHGFTIPPKYFHLNKNIVSISRGIQQDILKRAGITSTIIYNGIRIDAITKRLSINPFRKDTFFKIVQVGRLYHEVKGQDILLKAVSILQKKGYRNISVDFIGDGPSLKYLKEMAHDLSLENIHFLGNQPVEYINIHLSTYDLFVQPSIHEGFGLSVVEAMAAKIPVVISSCDGLMEVIDDGKYGLVFKKESCIDCANTVEKILKMDTTQIKELVDSAFKFIENKFDIKKTSDNYLFFYRECE